MTERVKLNIGLFPYSDGSGHSVDISITGSGEITIGRFDDRITVTSDEWDELRDTIDGCLGAVAVAGGGARQ